MKPAFLLVLVSVWIMVCRSHAGEQAVQRLVTFSYSDDDTQPTSLIQGSDGYLYGTTRGSVATGGSPNDTVFRLTAGGELNTLASFDPNGTNGCCPGALVQAQDGSFYGATAWPNGAGGTGAPGGIFYMATNGEVRLIFTFGGTNGLSARVLLYGADGNLYGTTSSGGSLGYGTVFKLTPAGQHTVLFSFSRTNGINPTSLARGRDGTLYGTTSDWIGINAPDTVFKLSPSGEFTTLSSSFSSGPTRPWSLVLAPSGDLYGVDMTGGPNRFGSVFRMTPTGAMTTLAEFNGTNGWGPNRLIQGTDGNIYGTTGAGGPDYAGWLPVDDGFVSSGSGTIFQATSGGITALASLQEMPGDDITGFVESADGILYGARTSGGPPEPNGIFRVVQQPVITGLLNLEGRDVLSWSSFEGGVYQVEYTTTFAASWTPLSPTIVAAGKKASLTNVVGSTAQLYYRVRLLPTAR
jgi:uncharacterized repeat protein (TIGR03803 family)